MRRILPLLFVLVSAGRPALAASVNLSPTTIVITSDSTKASVAVRNESSEPLRLRVQTVRWTNVGESELRTEPTDDIIVFPQLLQVEPGEMRRIRLGSKAPAARAELAYRLILTEAPREETADRSGLTMRMQFSLPVFVQPRERAMAVDVPAADLADGSVRLSLRNSGLVHVKPHRIETRGHNASGAVIWTRTFRPWYLLTGETRDLASALTVDECARTTMVATEVDFAGASRLAIRKQQRVASNGCR